jgi:hypothetical protein
MDEKEEFISLQEATKLCDYSQEYLSLRARQGKLKAVKIGRNWVTKKEWLQEYLAKVKEYNNDIIERRVKTVEPPQELAKVIESLKGANFVFDLQVRTGLVLGLALVLLMFGIVFGKDNIKSAFEDVRDFYSQELSPLSQQLTKELDRGLSEITQSLRFKTQNILAQTQNALDYTYTIGASEGSSVSASVSESAMESIAEFAENFDAGLNFLALKSKEKIVQSYKDSTFYLQSVVSNFIFDKYTLSAQLTQNILDNLNEFSQWLGTKIKNQISKIKEVPKYFTKPFQKPPSEPKPAKVPEPITERKPEKEIVREVVEVERVTKIEPVKEITRQIITIDDKSLQELQELQQRFSQFQIQTEREFSRRIIGVNLNPTVSVTGATSISTLGTITSGSWQAGTIQVPYGGTGLTSFTKGDLLVGSSTDALATLAVGSDGKVLTASSTAPYGLVWESATNIGALAIGSTVTSGTAGSLLFVDGSGNLGQNNSNLFWDNTNLRLGIGTSTPDTLLHVFQTGSGDVAKFSNATSSELLVIKNDGNVGIGSTSFSTNNGNIGRILKIGSNDNNVIVSQSDNLARALILEHRKTGRATSERVAQIQLGDDGVGAGNGLIKFYVAPNDPSDISEIMRIQADPSWQIPYGRVGIGAGSGAGLSTLLQVGGDFDGSFSVYDGTPTQIFYADYYQVSVSTESGQPIFYADRLTGRVGIGTTAPGTLLTLRKSSAGNVLAIRNTGDTADTFTITDQGIVNLGTWQGTAIGTSYGGTGLTSIGSANQLLGVNSGATGLEYKTISGTTNQITVTHAANSITLSTPQDINTGASPTFAGLTLSGLTQGSVIFAGASGAISQNNSNLFWDNTNLRLGIGTSTPAGLLHVATGTVDALVVDSARGNVGIGTTNFSTNNGNIGRILKIGSSDNNVIVSQSDNLARALILEHRKTGRATSERVAQIQLGDSEFGTDSGVIQFLVAPPSSDILEIMRIEADSSYDYPYGRVGIGAGGGGALITLLQVGGDVDGSFSVWDSNPTQIFYANYSQVSVSNQVGGPIFYVDRYNGRVGIGTNNPNTSALHVVGLATGAGDRSICATATGGVIRINSGSCGTSSREFKENIRPLQYGLKEVLEFNPVVFNYKGGAMPGRTLDRIGLIAEDVADIIPEVIQYQDGKIHSIDYPELVALNIKAIQELNLKVEDLAKDTEFETGSFAERFFANLFNRIRNWLADAGNGITRIFTQKIVTKEICVVNESGEETCLTKAQLDALISNQVSGSSGVGSNPQPNPEPNPQPSSEPTPQPSQQPNPEPTPEAGQN